jgi:hypothetical protein
VPLLNDNPPAPPSNAGKAFLDMLGVFAEFETNLRRERPSKRAHNPKAPSWHDTVSLTSRRVDGIVPEWPEQPYRDAKFVSLQASI